VGDDPPGRPAYAKVIQAMQARSARELAGRRGEVVAAIRSVAPLRSVNGGGTGSIERTATESAVTEIGAGSGLYQAGRRRLADRRPGLVQACQGG
jgi:hypothetical protein